MPTRTKQIILGGFLIYLVIFTYVVLTTIHQEMRPGLKANGDNALYMFFYLQPFGLRDSLFINFGSIAIIPILSTYYFIHMKNNNELFHLLQRIGYQKFIQMVVGKSFLVASIFSLIVNIYELILINWFYAPLSFSGKSQFLLTSKLIYFSSNGWVNLLTYIVLAAIGWGIYTVFILALGLFIRKNALYVPLGIVFGLGTILLDEVVLISMNKGTIQFANILAAPNLFSPGQLVIGGQNPPLGLWATYVIIVGIYALLIFALIKFWHKKQERGA